MQKNNQNKKRRLSGVVTSDAMAKTRVVSVERFKKHPKYQKYYRVVKKFKVHDEANQYHVGDKVEFEETKPISREKRWVIKGLARKDEPT